MTLRTTRCTTCNRRVYVSGGGALSCPVCSSPLSRSPSPVQEAAPSTNPTPSPARRHSGRLDEEMRLLGPRGLEQEKRIQVDVPSHPGAVGIPPGDAADQLSATVRTRRAATPRPGPDFHLVIERSDGACTIRCAGYCDELAGDKLTDAVDVSVAAGASAIMLDLREALLPTPRVVLTRMAELCQRRGVTLELLPGEAIRRSLNRDGWDDVLQAGIKVLDSLRFDVSALERRD